MRVRGGRVAARALWLALITLLILANPSYALKPSVQANVLGGNNGAGYGNRGDLYSVNQIADTLISDWLFFGYELPLVVGTQEICRQSGNDNDQHDTLSRRLRDLAYYARNFYRAKNGDNPNCEDKGNAILAQKNDPLFSEWAAPSNQWEFPSGHQDPGDPEKRGRACVYPTVWFADYAACSAHLDNNNAGAATNQAADYFQDMAWQVLTGHGSVFVGDFNLTPGATGPQYFYSSGWAGETDGINLRPTGHSEHFSSCWPYPPHPDVKKIDYVWEAGYSPPQYPDLVLLSCVGGPLAGHRASDHYLIWSYL